MFGLQTISKLTDDKLSEEGAIIADYIAIQDVKDVVVLIVRTFKDVQSPIVRANVSLTLADDVLASSGLHVIPC